MFELGVRWVYWQIDLTLKTALIALLVAAALRLLRIRDSNIRHRVWMGTLLGMLLLPALTPLLPALCLPFIPSPDRLLTWASEPVPMEDSTAAQSRALPDERVPPAALTWLGNSQMAADPDASQVDRAQPEQAAGPLLLTANEVPDAGRVAVTDLTDALAVSPPPALAPIELPAQQPIMAQPLRRTIAAWVLLGIAAVWLLGSAALALRLAAGIMLAIRLLCRSVAVDAAQLQPRLPQPMSQLRIRECPLIRVPLTIGLLRPQVLLPREWRGWPAGKLHAVLAHEQMHVQRGDCMVALLAEINCCVYWFHPLAWWLKQHLALLAEEACDDAAIASLGDRTQYARHLLEIASIVAQQRGRLVAAGVSMARRSSVETRINAILDFTRPLSRRLTWLKAIAVVAIMVPLIALAAALQPSTTDNNQNPPPAKDVSTNASEVTDAAEKQPAQAEQSPLAETTFTFAGTAVDDRGEPIAGATVSLSYSIKMPAGEDLQRLATTDEHGRFSHSGKLRDLVDAEFPRAWTAAELIVSKEGFGFGIAPLAYLETSGRLASELTDRDRSIAEWHFGLPSSRIVLAADDVPIRGRIVDVEGRPVPGVSVVVAHLWRGKQGTLDDWLTAASKPAADDQSARQHLQHFSQSGMYRDTGVLSAPHALVVPTVQSDADGRFVLKGIGHERIVELYISGPGIATMTLLARSRPGETLRLAESPSNPGRGTSIYHPAEFTCIAGPTIPVTGRVTDHQTGQPLAGWIVQGSKLATSNIHGSFEAAYIHTTTDADGRYRLEGLPLGDNTVRVRAPRESGYFAATADISTKAGDEPPEHDVAVRRGVIVRGRVTDSTTGKPVMGSVNYFTFSHNPHWRSRRAQNVSFELAQAGTDGQFQITVLPGPGMLTFNASQNDHFPRGAGADAIDGPKSVTNDIFFHTSPYLVTPGNFNLLSPINPADDATDLLHDLTLTSGRSIICRVRRADGQPLSRCYLYGQQPFAGWFYRHVSESDTFTVQGYFPDVGRRVMVFQPEGNLVGWKDLTGDVPDEFEIVLRPGGKFAGRVVDEDGSPLAGLSIGSGNGDFLVSDRYSPAVAKTWGSLPSHLDGGRTLTDENGRFELPGVVPGLVYSGAVSGPQKMAGRTQMASLGRVFENATAASGETKDLGDLKIKPHQRPGGKEEEQKEKQQEKPPPQAPVGSALRGVPEAASTATYEIRGRVVGADGKAVAGAKFFWFRSRFRDLDPIEPRVIATTDASGDFNLLVPSVSQPDAHDAPDWHGRGQLVVLAAGHGFAVTSPEALRNQAAAAPGGILGALAKAVTGGSEPTIRLPEAGEPLRGRLVNIDGQPIAGASVKIRWFEEVRPAGFSGRQPNAKTDEQAAWTERVNQLLRVIEPVQLRNALPSATTNASGRFEIQNVGANRLFQLLVQGDDTQSTTLIVRNLPGETVTIPPARNFRESEVALYPLDFTAALGPSKPVTGRVTDLDTGEPVAGAIVRAYRLHGSNLHSSQGREEFLTRTGADGTYRLTGLPIGKDNRLVAFTTGDVPYIPVGCQADTTKSDAIQQNFGLKRGVWATGRVYDAETNKPFTGELSYFWFRDRQLEQDIPGLVYANLDGRYWTKSSGEFRVPVLPSRGILAFRYDGMSRDRDGINRFPRGYGAEAIEGSEPIGALKHFPTRPFYLMPSNFERVAEVHPQPGQFTVHVDLPLFATQPVTVRVVAEDGTAITGCEIYGASERWGWQQKQTAEFAIEDLRPGERRKIFAHHRLLNLAGAAVASRDEAQPIEIRLAPAGSVKGRLLDELGEPISDATLHANYDKLRTDDKTAIWPNVPKQNFNPTQVALDSEGRFEIGGFIPGWSYDAHAVASRKLNGQMIMNFGLGTAFKGVQVESGESKDLGDLRIRPYIDEQQEAKPVEPALSKRATREQPAPTRAVERSPDRSTQPDRRSPASESGPSDDLKQPPLHGRVVDETGRPIAGATIYIPGNGDKPSRMVGDQRLIQKAVSADDGRFSFSLTSEERGAAQRSYFSAGQGLPLIAFAAGRGVEWIDLPADGQPSTADIILRPQREIAGRLIDTEGRPVAGAKVAARALMMPKQGDTLDAFLAAWKQEPNLAPWHSTRKVQARFDRLLGTTTDAEGRFAIKGVASERICQLEFHAPDLVIPPLWIVNREGFSAKQHFQPPSSNKAAGAHMQLAESGVTHVCLPDFKLSGVVTSAGGQPVAGVRVWANSGYHTSVETETDASGSYLLAGLARNHRLGVSFTPPHQSQLLPRELIVTADGKESAKTINVVLNAGVKVSGRVIDAATGKGVPGGLTYVPLAGTEHVNDPESDVMGIRGGGTDRDGAFEFWIMPGPGVLMFQTARSPVEIDGQPRGIYRQASFSEEDLRHVKVNTSGGDPYFTSVGNRIQPLMLHQAVRYVNLTPDSPPQTLELKVDPGKTLHLEFVDAEGKALDGVFVSGVTESWPVTAQLTEPRVTIYALSADRPRHVVAIHRQRGLAGSIKLTGDESSPVRLRLDAAPSLRGRAVDASGQPLAAMGLLLNFSQRTANELYRFDNLRDSKLVTDSEGRFQIAQLIPGMRFNLDAQIGGNYLRARLRMDQRSLPAGQNLDLGDVVFASPQMNPDADAAPAAPVPSKSPPKTSGPVSPQVTTQVADSQGKPLAGAHVAAIGWRSQPRPGGDLSPRGEVIAEGTTDEQGRVQLDLHGASSKTHRYANLIARKDGLAVAWQKLNLEAPSIETSFKLSPDEPLRCKFIDIEGQPVVGAKLRVRAVMKRVSGDSPAEPDGAGFHGERTPAAWFEQITTGSEGRVEIRGIPPSHGVFLEVEPSDSLAAQEVALNTGMAEHRGERDATYRSLVRNAAPGEEVIIPLAPAQIFTGTVRYEDTKEPAPQARITIWASQQQFAGSMVSVEGRTDNSGRYRIHARPGIRFGLTAYPPEGAPYLTRKTDEDIRWESADRVKEVDLALPRGVLVRGRVVNAGTSQPIAGASIQYLPEETKTPRPRSILTGWQGIQLSNDDGQFQIPVLPGPGRLLVHAESGSYVLREFGSNEVYYGKPGGQRYYAHAIHKLDPQSDSQTLDVTIELQLGAAVAGQIIDEQGKPIPEAVVNSRLDVWDRSLSWRASSEPVLGGRFELTGLDEGVEYAAYFLDPKRRLGATVHLNASDPQPTVTLRPCGSATVRFVDKEGQPVADHHPMLEIVVTPGVYRFAPADMKKGQLAADSDYVPNIDRLNHGNLKTDAEGKVTLPALIPGATYRLTTAKDGQLAVAKEFTVQPGEKIDLGDIQIHPRP